MLCMLSTLYCVCCQPCTVCAVNPVLCVLSTLYCVCCQPCTVCWWCWCVLCVLSTLYCVCCQPCTVCAVNPVLCVLSTLYCVCCQPCTVCAVNPVLCVLLQGRIPSHHAGSVSSHIPSPSSSTTTLTSYTNSQRRKHPSPLSSKGRLQPIGADSRTNNRKPSSTQQQILQHERDTKTLSKDSLQSGSQSDSTTTTQTLPPIV